MKKIVKIELPEGWTKQDKRTIVHTSGAFITLKDRRFDYRYNPRKFQIRMPGRWIHQYEVTGEGMWIAEFNTLLEAIAFAEKELKKESRNE